MIETRIDLLRKTPLFARLPDEALAGLAEAMGKRTFARGMILFHKDSPGHNLYVVESGLVRIFLLSESGQEITLNVHGPGECFGELALLDGQPRSAGAMAIERTVTHTLHRDQFLSYLEANPRLIGGILAQVGRHLRNATSYAESLAFLGVPGRLAARLLELAGRYGTPGDDLTIDLHLTQAELASYVAASREMTNKVLGSFRDRGLIRIDGQKITILDRAGLRREILY